MFKAGTLVKHKVTGVTGRVLGYGSQVSGHIYFITLKVKPLKRNNLSAYIEDKMNKWHFLHLDDPQAIDPKTKHLSLVA